MAAACPRLGGKLLAKDILPDPTTVQRNLEDVATAIKDKIKLEIQKISGAAFTTDIWTCDYRKKNYTSVTVHYIDKQWSLNYRTLGVKGL